MNAQSKYSDGDYQRKVGDFVNREVYYCVSSLIYELSQNEQYMYELMEEQSIPDYETPAYAEGWRVEERNGFYIYFKAGDFASMREALTYQSFDDEESAWIEVCNNENIEPEYPEVFEHWIISDWLADKLKERGEIVFGFMGLTIWGRQTTGQAILLDRVICNIYDSLQ